MHTSGPDIDVSRAVLLDSTARERSYALPVTSRHAVSLSESAYIVLKACETSPSYEAAAEALARETGTAVGVAELKRAHLQIRDKIRTIEATPSPGWPYWWRRELLSTRVVARLAQPLGWLFRPIVAVPLVCAAIAVTVACTEQAGSAGSSDILLGYVALLGTLLAHELGHAAACARYGAPPGEIGVTMYIIYPAFFSNVTSAWVLKRWQRVVVDLGGAYFQLLAIGALAGAYAVIGRPFLLIAIWFGLSSIAFTLNPWFKFDGYWLTSDALGVENLRAQIPRIARYALAKMRGRRVEPLPWPRWVIAVLIVYSVTSVLWIATFLYVLAPVLWAQVEALAAHATSIWIACTTDQTLSSAVLVSLAGPLFTLVLPLFAFVRLGRYVARSMTRRD